MTSTDVSEVTTALDGIQIDGPHTASLPTEHPPIDSADILPEAQEQRMEQILGEDTANEGATGFIPVAPLETALTPRPASEALFATDKYLAVPTIDGQAADVIKITFTGGVEYEASDPDGQELLAKLRLGQEVELRVAGVVARKAGSWKTTGKEGEEVEVVTGAVALKVTELWRLAPEDLA